MGEEAAFRINLVVRDPLLAERLRLLARRLPDLRLLVTPEPMPDPQVDACVLPVDLLPSQEGPDEIRPPTLCYGPARALRRAWLCGCDDYLKEPWDLDELECRLRRLLQRRRDSFTFSWGVASLGENMFRCPAGRVGVSGPEARILRTLILHRDQPVRREALFYAIWGRLPQMPSRVVDVHVSRLRRRLAPLFPEGAGCIETVRGSGYRFAAH